MKRRNSREALVVRSNGQRVNRGHGERSDFRRNRKIHYPPHSVKTDGVGGILERPFTKGLPCFGELVEWLRGRQDEPSKWGDNEPQARGCAKCPVAAFCATVAWERITTSPRLMKLYQTWEQMTCGLAVQDRFVHPTWSALVAASDAHSWSDINDLRLDEDLDHRGANGSGSSAPGLNKRARPVPAEIAEKITKYRDDRVTDLVVSQLSPSPPLWIRNRTLERCVLVADAWQAREMLREAGAKTSGPEIVRSLVEQGRIAADLPIGIVERVNEALRRADRLVTAGDWPPFEPRTPPAPRQAGHGMHGSAIFLQLDD